MIAEKEKKTARANTPRRPVRCPQKTGINLNLHEKRTGMVLTLLVGVLCITVLALAVAKFGVLDLYDRLADAQSAYAQAQQENRTNSHFAIVVRTDEGISFGVHLVILMLVAATGLFQAVSTESHPVDVEIYDKVTEDEQPSDDSAEAEAQAAAPEPEAAAPDLIVIDESRKVPEVEKETKDEKPDKQDKAKPDKQAKNPSADAKANASDAKGTNGAPGGKEGGSDKP